MIFWYDSRHNKNKNKNRRVSGLSEYNIVIVVVVIVVIYSYTSSEKWKIDYERKSADFHPLDLFLFRLPTTEGRLSRMVNGRRISRLAVTFPDGKINGVYKKPRIVVVVIVIIDHSWEMLERVDNEGMPNKFQGWKRYVGGGGTAAMTRFMLSGRSFYFILLFSILFFVFFIYV